MPWLVRLMSSGADLAELTDDQLIEGVSAAREARKRAEGRACAELHSRGWTWDKIGAALGVSQSTAHRWAKAHERG